MKNAFLLALIVAVIAGGGAPAMATAFQFDQPYGSIGFAAYSNTGPGNHQIAADDFQVPVATCPGTTTVITGLTWWGQYQDPVPAEPFRFEISLFHDVAGLPGGAPLFQTSAVVLNTSVMGVLQYDYTFATPFDVSGASNWWIAIAEADGRTAPVGGTQWQWSFSRLGSGSDYAYADTSGVPWAINSAGDLAFRVHGEVLCVPEPGMILLAMPAILGLWVTRRRHSA